VTRAYERIRVVRDAGVETITLAYPQRRNAIGPRMTNEILWAFDDAVAADEVRSIVLTGEGGAFCSGGDFGEMAAGGGASDGGLAPKGDYADLMLALVRGEKPSIAKVNGIAFGGGLGLAAACTFAVASLEAKLGTPEIDVGIYPMMIMGVLARHVPRRRMVEMSLLGQKFSAEEAVRLGLLNRAVPAAELDAEVRKITDAIASKSPVTVRLGLKATAAQEGLGLDESLPMLRARLGEVLATDDCREGLMAFFERRPPRWTGK
jgi:enoyl-CoA hydratase/carnithine racemase